MPSSDELIHKEKHVDYFSFDCALCWEAIRSDTSSLSDNKSNSQTFGLTKTGNFSADSAPETFQMTDVSADVQFKEMIDHTYCKSETTKSKNYSINQFPCKICKKCVYKRPHVQIHTWIYHEHKIEENPLYICDSCGENFTGRDQFKAHLFQHAYATPTLFMQQKLFECKPCDKLFAHKSRFDEHMLRHTGEKPYPCKVCNRRYTSRKSLNKHLKTHTTQQINDATLPRIGGDIEPNSLFCDYCKTHLTTSGRKQVHMWKFHEANVPNSEEYVCEICYFTDSRRLEFKEHMCEAHNFTMKQKCPKCDQKISKQFLAKHLMTSHAVESPFLCKVCKEGFKRRHLLTAHMEKKHSKKELLKYLI